VKACIKVRWLLGASLVALCALGSVGAPADPEASMRAFVVSIARHAREAAPDFLLVAQDGLELLTESGRIDGLPAIEYVAALDGVGQEDVTFGYTGYGNSTLAETHAVLLGFLDLAERLGLAAFVIDYCRDADQIKHALSVAAEHGFVGYAAPSQDLEVIPEDTIQPWAVHSDDVRRLSEARNVLFLINPERYGSKGELVNALAEAPYDVLVVDGWFDAGVPLSAGDLAALGRKPGGGERLVLAYLSIGEAEDYRADWSPSWALRPPAWLGDENPDWPGNYAVRYWDPEWQAIVFARLDGLIAAGFDGVYLDKVDAFDTAESAP